jgi:hypothetical protein
VDYPQYKRKTLQKNIFGKIGRTYEGTAMLSESGE